MSKIQITDSIASGHTCFEIWNDDHYYDQFVKMDVRRCVNSGSDEAQIELMVMQTPNGGKRTTKFMSSIILSPDDARKLALALCPELQETRHE